MDTAVGTPRGLTVARVIMFAQAVATLGVWVVQLLTISTRLDHGQHVSGFAWVVIVANPAIAVLLFLAALRLLAGPDWARPLAVTMQVIGMVTAAITAFTGFYQGVLAIGLAIVVIVLISRHPAD
ncbi:hypothetical protein [Crossiella cryophila]|uniref:Glucan phosphoethanolaminetransferase (Alkaline phosphatase superfamily) n=1 Tax=Crossiella cryophila TaxID=43355 RepID=A0A7W7CDJ0_9PSEU|nr:hypothetical protein [Crossiella cryophila]MBB4679197.1 glucan phosphoethanolaminetransferase (alkaline phosphatase superfamily) [Crossiella cryophila]